MSIRARAIRRTTATAVGILAMLAVAPSAAVADPPALNRNDCSILLARAAVFPGGFESESGSVRLVSDAYVSHLSAQPPCSCWEHFC